MLHYFLNSLPLIEKNSIDFVEIASIRKFKEKVR